MIGDRVVGGGAVEAQLRCTHARRPLLVFTLLICLAMSVSGELLRIPSGSYIDRLPGFASSQGHELDATFLDLVLEDVDIEVR